jgi:PhzF family phenazine biosynthesis protein
MHLRIYQIDAFAEKTFEGNPAAVIPLSGEWLDESFMRKIAMENNLSETAFYLFKNNRYHIRWFTPSVEVDLCGHATLATAHVLFVHEQYEGDSITFDSRSGPLRVQRDGGYLTMDFPVDRPERVKSSEELLGCFDLSPIEILRGKTDYMFIYETEGQIRNIQFDLQKIQEIQSRGIIITARGERTDFVSRFFAPQSGIDEDPVTGSAHTTLTPYWSEILGKRELTAAQLSARGGHLKCCNRGDRVEISGRSVTYMRGELEIE